MENASGAASATASATAHEVLEEVPRPPLAVTVQAQVAVLRDRLALLSLPMLRVGLGIVFLWFGVLKLTGDTPVNTLVANTLPFLPAHVVVPALGIFESMIGLALLTGRYLPIVAALMVAHLTGTFLVLVVQPNVAFQNGNPLMLTMTGEFVVKNVVLIVAGLVLVGRSRAAERE